MDIPAAHINGVGDVIVVLILFWLLATGRTKPRADVDNLVTAYDKQVAALKERVEDEQHEKGEWRTESRLKDQTLSELNQQNRAMLDAFGPTLTDFLQSLRRAG